MVSKKLSTKPGPKLSSNLKDILSKGIKSDLIIGPALDEFLVQWDGTIKLEVADRIAKTMSSKQRNRAGSWSASSAGLCLRRQEFSFLGMPTLGSTNPRLQQIFSNGTWVHLRWQAVLMTAGLLDNIEVVIKKPSKNIRCSMDGMGTGTKGRYEGREFGFELKGRNDFAFMSQVAKGVDEKTRAQVDFEFLLSGLDLFVVVNENKNNQQIKEWIFLRDENRIKEMARQINELNRAIEVGRLHPMLDECRKQIKGSEFTNCPYGGVNGPCTQSGNWPSKLS